jgi:hypothetical protein
MFQLSLKEFGNLKSQNVTSSWGGARKPPRVFTEQGIYMLATILKGEIATKQSLAIMRTFRTMRHYVAQNEELLGYNDYKILTEETLTRIQFDVTQNRKDIDNLMNHFINDEKVKEFIILDGQKFIIFLEFARISNFKHSNPSKGRKHYRIFYSCSYYSLHP